MYRCCSVLIVCASLPLICLSSSTVCESAEPPFVFRDTTQESGLLPDVSGIKGHAVGWGDADGDGWLDLYVAGFHQEEAEKPNMFFRNDKGKFKLDAQPALKISTRPTGALFADLDNDGDLDLYVSSMPYVPAPAVVANPKALEWQKRALVGCTLFRNDGGGKFTDISANNGACPKEFGGRSVAVLDFDGNGLLDLLVGEEPTVNYNGSKTRSSRLFRNLGKLQFEDVTQSVGIPAGIPGLGVAAADVNNDTWPDLFIACHDGGNRLFLNNGRGQFTEAPGAKEVFAWSDSGGKIDNQVSGICFGDVNRDGLLDAVIGHHYSKPWVTPVADRLYLNRGIKNGVPTYEDATAASGLVPLTMKAPHVEIQDFDNDGWMDISISVAKFAKGQTYPLIFKNLGAPQKTPKFQEYTLGVNDYPEQKDREFKGASYPQLQAYFNGMLQDHKIVYTVAAPSGDYDNDGRLDLFMPNWWSTAPSMLLHNETPSGNWLDVQVEAPQGVNRAGIGSRVNIYPAGKLGQAAELIGDREIASGFGYASGQAAIAHFGLGKLDSVDVEVVLPHGKGKLTQKAVKANQRITVKP